MPFPDDSAPVAGTRDILPPDLTLPRRLEARLRDFLSSCGYLPVDVPVLEHTDVYLRKLGSRVAAHMFTLVDQEGESLCLRPEFTGSVIRTFIAHAYHECLPVRWQYSGPVFRDRSAGVDLGPRSGQLRQFTQIGVELIGPAGPRSDAELLAVAQQALPAAGLPAPRAVVGHAGLVHRLLSGLQLSERVRLHIASHLGDLRQGTAVAALREELAQMIAPALEPSAAAGLLSGVAAEEAASMARWLLSEGITRPTGRRTPEEILQRFQAKLQGRDDPRDLERALALASALAPVRDEPERALAEARSIVSRFDLDPAPLGELAESLSHLAAYGLGPSGVEVDLGLTRPLGYYTGVVFELFMNGESGLPVGGGGRYDGLVRALGGPDVPALGFAYTLESLARAAFEEVAADSAPAVLVVPGSDRDLPAALRHLRELRKDGVRGLLEVIGRDPAGREEYCRASGIARMALVTGDRIEYTDLPAPASRAVQTGPVG